MSLIVMKFGGSSVGDAERMKRVANRILERKREGNQCVVIVSAMGDTTDDLIDLADQLHGGKPSSREMDMLLSTGEQVSMSLLSMAIQGLGGKAKSFTGWQAGIETESDHSRARITDIQPQRILDAIADDNIVIVAGFQGTSQSGEITTLGRGGSDTTAVAIAAAIQADVCEIYTDVEGIYSTDPRIVQCARKLQEISYDEMLELAHLGAAVLHPRAVECAKHHQVNLVVRSSFSNNSGTSVKEEAVMEKGAVVRGIATDKNIARISILGVPERVGQLSTVFKELADAKISVDIIIQSGVQEGLADFSFSVSLDEVEPAMEVIRRIQPQIGYREATSETGLVKVSIVGAGMASSPGVAAAMFEAISNLGVSINMVSTSEIKVSCVIKNDKIPEVVRALHTTYGLDTEEQVYVGGPKDRR